MQPEIILASSSPFRRELLQRLHIDFTTRSPDIDESLQNEESASDYVMRLAWAKAQTIANDYPDAIVIGSDQCAVLDGEILGKPGDHDRALDQLRRSQGKTVVFHTGISIVQACTGFHKVDEVLFEVDFRELEDEQLDHYLRMEEPYDCAGSFKSEGYGICLFKGLRGDDPTALIGLPLLRTIEMLEAAGVEVV